MDSFFSKRNNEAIELFKTISSREAKKGLIREPQKPCGVMALSWDESFQYALNGHLQADAAQRRNLDYESPGAGTKKGVNYLTK